MSGFVKLDCGIIDSSLWMERDVRSVFLTALIMAEPVELKEATEQLQVRSLTPTGWKVPPGWYGLVGAAASGIIRRDGIEKDAGLRALEILGEPDEDSRSSEYEGRRLVRVSGGYLVLNYFKYRERDYTSAARSKRYRERKRVASHRDVTETPRDITQAEAEAEAYTTPQRFFALGWVREFVELAGQGVEVLEDTRLPQRIAAALKPLVDKYGSDSVRDRWVRFLSSQRVRYGPEHFATNYADFAPGL